MLFRSLHGDREDGSEDGQRERPDETPAQKNTRDGDDNNNNNNNNNDGDGDSEHTDSEIYEEEEDGVGDDFEA